MKWIKFGIPTLLYVSARLRRAETLFLLVTSVLFVSPAFSAVLDTHTPEDAILAKGFSAFMDGRYKQSMGYFEEVIRINPRNNAAQDGLSQAKVKLRKLEDVQKSKNKKLAEAKVREGRGLMKTKDLVAAIDSFHAAVDAVPDYKPALKELKTIKDRESSEAQRKRLNLSTWAYARGVLAYLDRDWAKSYRIWSERSRLEPTNVQLTNATARAEKNFKEMMVTEREEFFRRGGRAFYEQGLYKEAKGSWDQVLTINGEDLEALEGRARAEDAILSAEGKNRDSRVHDLLEQALEYYATQSWRKSLELFTAITQLDPEFSTAKDYITKLNEKLTAVSYSPTGAASGQSWRPSASVPTENAVPTSDKLDNYVHTRGELESQLKRDPANIRAQQELDNVIKAQEAESDRVYKDGLIAYSQGNRAQAISYWKQALVIFPDHKKAGAALKKARAEEERMEDPSSGTPE